MSDINQHPDQVCKFATEAETDTHQAAQYASHMSAHPDDDATAWDEPRQRTDGDWTVFVCPDHSTDGQTVVDFDEADYPAHEE